MARNPPEAPKRTLSVLLSPEDEARVRDAAHRERKTMSAWIRDAVLARLGGRRA